MQHPEVQVVLFHHPSINNDQQVLMQLLQTSKELSSVVTQQCSAQLAAVLCTEDQQQVLSFAHHWLPKHAGLLRSLHMHLRDHSSASMYDGGAGKWSTTVQAVAAALQYCTWKRTQDVRLQSLSLVGCPAGPLLLQLPVKHLTRLCAAVDFTNPDSARHVARLKALRSLDLSRSEPYRDSSVNALAPLQRLVHLTELHIGRTYTKQLKLPPALQQLHVVVDINCASQQLQQLAGWLQQHGSVVRSLKLVNVQRREWWDPVWEDRLAEVAAAFGGAPAAAAGEEGAERSQPAAQAAAAVTGQTVKQLQLAHLSVEGHSALGLALQQLPATGSLTSLECRADFGRAAAQLAALARHTGLRSLQLWGTMYSELGGSGAADCQADDVLAPLAALRQLTLLKLGTVRPAQLSHLPMNLLQLEASLFAGEEEDDDDGEAAGDAEGQQAVLQMGHLTALTSLVDCLGDDSGEHGDGVRSHPMGQRDVFPPNLQQLEVSGICHSVVPLLPLQQLQQARLCFAERPPAGPELARLTSLGALTELRLAYCTAGSYDAAAADAWAALPLRSLKLMSWAAPHASNKPPVLPAEVVGRLPALTQLTCLEVGVPMLCGCLGVHLQATPGQLAAALAPLTGLHELHLSGFACMAADDDAAAAAGGSALPTRSSRLGSAGSRRVAQHGVAGVEALMDALAGLKRMRQMHVELPLAMSRRDASRAARAAQRMPSWVAEAWVWEEGLQVKV
jgi:hypothetical protein